MSEEVGAMMRCRLHGCYHPYGEYCPQCDRALSLERPKVPHYQQGGIEPIDYIRSHNLNHCEGNIIKYVTRWPFKGGVADLIKARDYLNWLIEDAESIPNAPCRCAKVNHVAPKDRIPAIDADKLGPQKTPSDKR